MVSGEKIPPSRLGVDKFTKGRKGWPSKKRRVTQVCKPSSQNITYFNEKSTYCKIGVGAVTKLRLKK